VFVSTILAGYEPENPIAWWDLDDNEEYSKGKNTRVPFPQCLKGSSGSNYFESSSLQSLFDRTLRDEEYKLKREGYENYQKSYNDILDYDADEYRNGNEYNKARLSPRAAIKLTGQIMRILTCDLNGTDTNNLNKFLNKFTIPGEFCTYLNQLDCSNRTSYRTATGVCNNFKSPYQGSSQTAFGRILPASYDDHLSKPRQRAKYGGYLPECRKISLELGSKPVFNRDYNNLFVIFGQFIAHDMALSTPVTDNYLTPVTTCKCDAKYDWNKCNVINIQPDDPYLRGQKCMAFPATAQAFQGEVCSLGVKEQMNGNTHFLDLSGVYGSTLRIQQKLRTDNGLLKSSKPTALKYEYPPGQQEGKSCVDSSYKRPCLAGGDSRLMENLLFTSIQALFIRLHNAIARELFRKNPTVASNPIYEVSRRLSTQLFQIISFGYWVPKLLGTDAGSNLLRTLVTTPYNSSVPAVVYNEVATGAFRCHTLVRDLFSRCTPDGKRIDQLWLHDISHKARYLYDYANNGIDSLLCGSLYDYGFSHDGNFAHQIHHRLFESTNRNGYLWRNDLVAINICRGREHGLQSYNAYREYCGFKKAYYFEDFGKQINYDGIKLLRKHYKHPDDVDLFVGITLEDKLPNALIGPTTACLLRKQFEDLAIGDRFFIGFKASFTKASFYNTAVTALRYLLCKTVDIQKVAKYPFTPPDDTNNVLIDCSTFIPPNTDIFVGPATVKGDGSENDGPTLNDLIGRFTGDTTITTNPDGLNLSP
jgi:peroxidase